MEYIVKLNGIYDIACGLCILKYIYIPYLGSIHLNMIIKNENNRIFQRYYAYWILTYGYMRLTTISSDFVRMSYFIEAACIANELYTNDIQKEKALFVIVASLALGLKI